MKKIIKDAGVLFLITLIAGVLLGAVFKITKEPIAEQKEAQKIAAYENVFSDMKEYTEISGDEISKAMSSIEKEGYDSVSLNECVKAFDKDNKELGMIITVTDKGGYGGDIKITVGIDSEGAITGLEILEISETAGLGMNAKEESFRNQFKGIKADSVTYTKTGKEKDNEIDAISAATITTKSVTRAVNGALIAYRTLGGAAIE